ncbi:MAG: translocation/assembly module TamB domain-containing protein, partial [Acidobacteriota bacterium]|nr:translocation/assembly module TamB domain-containing protein [Acidobacteriota bacterium]
LRGLRLSGYYVRGPRREAVEGRIARIEVRRRDLDVNGIAVTALGGAFTGEAQVRGAARYSVAGEFAGIQAARAVAMYSPQKLPWNALVYGKVHAQGAFRDSSQLQAGGDLTLSPVAGGEPVNGHVTAAWDARSGTLDLGSSTVALPHSHIAFSGAVGRQLRVHADTADLNDILPALGESADTFPVKLRQGSAAFDGTVSGRLSAPRVSGHLRASGIVYQDTVIDTFEADALAAPDIARLQNAVVTRGKLRAQAQGSVVLSGWKAADTSPVAGSVSVRDGSLADLLAIAGAKSVDAAGSLTATAFVSGTVGVPRVEVDANLTRGSFQGEPFDRLTGHAAYSGHVLEVRQARLTAGAKQVNFSGAFDHAPGHFDSGRVRFDVTTNAMPLESIRTLHAQREDLTGTVQAAMRGEVALDPAAKTTWRVLALNGDLAVKGLVLADQPVGDGRLTVQSAGQVLRASLEATAAGAALKGSGEWKLEGAYPGHASVEFHQVDLVNLRAWLTLQEASRVEGSADGELQVDGQLLDQNAMRAELRILRFEMGAASGEEEASKALRIANRGPIVAHYAKSVLTVDSFHLVGPGTDLTAGGRIATGERQPLDLRVEGHADLRFVGDFLPDVVSEGAVVTNATIRGTYAAPQFLGRMEFQKAAFNIEGVPNGISNASGTVAFNNDRATIQNLSGETGGGRIDLAGFVQYGGGGPLVFRLHARARQVRVRYPEGVSTLANASLNLTGTQDSSTLAGTITILRTGVNLQSDFSSLLAKSAEPVRTPSAKPGLLGGMGFDVQIETAPETQFESSLTEGIQAEASLRLRGTVTNPAVLGRITITQGKLVFFGTQYSVNQGTINFYNPIKVEPILNIDLETKARGIEITLSVTGPLNKLTLTPRSDPPLQFSEIVALLAQGRTPTSDPSLLRQQTDSPQTFQQAGASALLGSAIANPVAGRLQRFFGVSKLRIDPSISGVEYNPQARLTLEQQVTPNLTFTYITDVTTSNPQVVQVEWAISRQWSAVALREENGLLGLDFFYKKRFK